jgi:aminopeptidase YwaD
MQENQLAAAAAQHLEHLCVTIPDRAVGTQGNRDAATYVAGVFTSLDWEVETPSFQCMDWSESGVDLRAGTTTFEAKASPYTLGALVSDAVLVVAGTIEELEAANLTGRIALLRDELGKEQLAPKNFPWWNPDEHRRIIAALEAGQPAAIIAATTRNPETAGALYPFPLIEDGDFDIPSAYMTEEEGQKLAVYAGREIDLEIKATRVLAEGSNVVARRGAGGRRILVTAHLDAKRGTPGATDNAAGVVTLLLLAGLLPASDAGPAIELVAFNGEDYYAAPGEQLYLQQNEDLSAIDFVINVDGAGYRDGGTNFSLYQCPDELAARARNILGKHGLTEGPQWYQGDHTMFVMAGRPAIAITSEQVGTLAAEYIHTPRDTPDIVDTSKLARIAQAIAALLK